MFITKNKYNKLLEETKKLQQERNYLIEDNKLKKQEAYKCTYELTQIVLALREFFDEETAKAILVRAYQINANLYLKPYEEINIIPGIMFFLD